MSGSTTLTLHSLSFPPFPSGTALQAAADKAKKQVEAQKAKAREATDKAEKAMDEGVSKAKGLFGGLKDMLK